MESTEELCRRFAEATCMRIGLPHVYDLRMISINVGRSMSWGFECDERHK